MVDSRLFERGRGSGSLPAGLMVGAIATVHLSHGFFMNWSGQQQGEGFEYHLLVIGIGSRRHVRAIPLVSSG